MASTRATGGTLPTSTGPGFASVRKGASRMATRRLRNNGTLRIVALLLGVSCSGVDEPPRPEILGSNSIPVALGSAGTTIYNSMIFSLDISSGNPGCRETGVAIFYQTIIRDGDDHHTLVAEAGNEPDFAAFAHLLTDGVDESITACVTLGNFAGSGATGGAESVFFGGRPGTAPDFAGYTIDRVEFHIDSVLIASPGSDQNHDGIWTDSYLAGRVVVWGHR